MLKEFIVNQKTHIIYVIVLLVVAGVGYNLLSRKPKEIIKTETKIVEVAKDVVKVEKVFVDKIIVTKKRNGDVITETDKSRIEEQTVDKSHSVATVTKTEVVKFMSRYSIDVMYPLGIENILNPSLDPRNIQVMAGVRVFSLPVFVTAGTDGHFNKIILGVRVEM